MTVTGTIVDNSTGNPLPGATVELWYNNVMLKRVAADNDGYFRIDSTSSGNKLIATHVDYKTGSFDKLAFDPANRLYGLDEDVEELENVYADSVIPKIKKEWVLPAVLIGLVLVLVSNDKR